MKARALHLAVLPEVSPNAALVGAGITLAAVGAVIYAGPKALAIAGTVGGCLFAAAVANTVVTAGCQLASDGYDAAVKALDDAKQRSAKPAGKTEVHGEKVAAA